MGGRLTQPVKELHFNETVDVVVFNRTIGGAGIPHDGNITMTLNQEIDQTVEPLQEEPDTKTHAERDGYKSPSARTTLLIQDMGKAAYKKNVTKSAKLVDELKKKLKESKNDKGDYRSMATSAKQALDRGKRDAKEVRKMWGILPQKIKVAIQNVEEESKKIVKKSFSKGKQTMKKTSAKKMSKDELHHDDEISDRIIAKARDKVESALQKKYTDKKRKLMEEESDSESEDEWGDVEGYEGLEDGSMPADSFAKRRKK